MWESTEMSFLQEWEHHHTTFMQNDSTLLVIIISCILVIYSYLKHDIIFKKSLYVEGVVVNQQDANFAEVISYTGSLQVNHTLHAYTLVSSPPLNLKENYDLALAKGICKCFIVQVQNLTASGSIVLETSSHLIRCLA